MASLDKAPVSVQGWFAADKAPDYGQALRAVVTPDVFFDFGARSIRGVDAVVAAMTLMMPPGWLGDPVWSLLPAFPDGRVTVRGVGRDGVPLTSPGGPIDVIDFVFTLGNNGLIAVIAPKPHHVEPKDLPPTLRSGDIGPDFVLPDVHGVKVPLRQDGTKATVVVFTCNHCPWALGWHERLQRVARDYASRGVRFLQINPDDPAVNIKDGIEASLKRVAAGAFAGPYLVDDGQAVARRWGARNTPEVFVLNTRGVIAYHGAADADVENESLNAGWLRDALDQVLAGKSPSPSDTPPVGCSIKWTLQ